MKSEQRLQAIILRKSGMAIGIIAKQLAVSKGTVSKWVSDIMLTQDQINHLKQQNPIYNRQIHGGKARAAKAREKRLTYQNEGRLKAQEKNLLHQAGCMLYWAEGSKSKNSLCFVNSDIQMIKFFLKFLKESFNLSNEDITISVNCYTNNGLSKNEIESFWISELRLELTNLRKGQENNRPRSSTNIIRHHKLIYGICTINVKRSTHIVQHIYGAIQEYAQFNNNYMLM